MLNTYYASLSEMIRKLGSDPDELYSFKQLQMQLEKFGEYALLFSPLLFSVRLADEKDFVDAVEIVKRYASGEDVHYILSFVGEKQKKWHNILNGVVTDLVDYGYINTEKNKY